MKIGDKIRFLRRDGKHQAVHVYGVVVSQEGMVVTVRLSVGLVKVGLSELEVVR